MTVDRFNEIKEKIEAGKERKAKAEGVLERIREQWKTDFGVDSIEAAEETLEEMNGEIEKAEARLESIAEQLEGVTDWGAV